MRKKKISWCKSIIPCIIGVAASWDPNCHGSAASQGAIVRNNHSRTIICFASFFDSSAPPPKKKERLILSLPIQEDGNHRLGWSNQERHGKFSILYRSVGTVNTKPISTKKEKYKQLHQNPPCWKRGGSLLKAALINYTIPPNETSFLNLALGLSRLGLLPVKLINCFSLTPWTRVYSWPRASHTSERLNHLTLSYSHRRASAQLVPNEDPSSFFVLTGDSS